MCGEMHLRGVSWCTLAIASIAQILLLNHQGLHTSRENFIFLQRDSEPGDGLLKTQEHDIPNTEQHCGIEKTIVTGTQSLHLMGRSRYWTL